WQTIGYDLVRDYSVIKSKNSKWHSKLTTQKPFTFRDWSEFRSDAGFSFDQINMPHYLSKQYKSQSAHEKSKRNESIRIYEKEKQYAINNGKGLKGRDQMNKSLRQKRKRNKIIVAAAAVAAVAVALITRKYKKTGQGKETRRFREPMETRTGWRMMNATDKWRMNPNIDLNYISPLHNTPHKPSSPHPQQQSPSPPLEVTLALLRSISSGDPRGHKEKEPESKQQKLQQYTGLMDVIERLHEIMKPIIEEEKQKPKAMLPGQYKHYPNKDGPAFFYPPQNYHPTPIPRPKDLNLSEEQWQQFDGDVREGVVPYQSETESENQEQLTNQIERIVADGTDDNEDNDQSEHAIELKLFTNGSDGLRKNGSGTQLQATVNGEANPEINITKISA
ncbi:MAG: hypothetical protein EZS28_043968, partial [Streblomastix strix]